MSEFKWEYLFNVEVAIDALPFILEGAWYTLLIAIVSMVLALVLGLFVALARMNKLKLISYPARLFISFYTAEVIRSAISSVAKGQWEAAETLRMTYWQTMRRIILPQGTRIALPPLSSVFMDIIKGTSLAMVITVSEMFYRAKVVVGQTYESLTLYILVALIYWAICSVVTVLQDYLEKKANRYVTT